MSVTLLEGMVIGGVGGFIASVTFWFFQCLKEKQTVQADKKTVYNSLTKLCNEHIPKETEPYFVSTIDLAAYTNLTPDRIRYICSTHEKIIPMREKDTRYILKMKGGNTEKEPLEERWTIRDGTNEVLKEK